QSGPVAATVGDLDIGPGQPGVGERVADRLHGELPSGDPGLPAEAGQPAADDRNLLGHRTSLCRRVMVANRGTGAAATRRTRARSRSAKSSQSTIASTRMPSGSST